MSPDHLAMRAAALAPVSAAFDGNGHHPGTSPPPEPLGHVGEHRFQIAAGISGRRNVVVGFLNRQSITQEVISIGPMSVDRGPGHSRCFRHPKSSDRVRTFLDEKGSSRLEDYCTGSGDAGVAPSRMMRSESFAVASHIFTVQHFVA
jgi:hypothetical protein